MDKLNGHRESLIGFVLWRTGLPIDSVEELIDIQIPTYWGEAVRNLLENYDNPAAINLHEKMIQERMQYVEKLSKAEQAETYEVTSTQEYILRLILDGAVEEDTAIIFAKAVMEWYRNFKEAITGALLNNIPLRMDF